VHQSVIKNFGNIKMLLHGMCVEKTVTLFMQEVECNVRYSNWLSCPLCTSPVSAPSDGNYSHYLCTFFCFLFFSKRAEEVLVTF
jgi:hypothetical protein